MVWEANSTHPPHLNEFDEQIAYMFRLNDDPYLFGFCVLLDLVTFVIQSVTCYVFWCGRTGLCHPTTRLLFNQSFAELCVVLGHAVNILAPSPVDLPPTTASEALCRLWMSRFLMWGLYSVAFNSLLLSSFDRYLATLHPIKHRTRFGTAQATTGIVTVWVYGFAWTSSVTISVTSLNQETGLCGTSTSAFGITLAVFSAVCGVALPTVLLEFFFFSIFWRLRKTSLEKGKVHGAVYRRAKINTLITMAIICINYHLTLIPVYVICFFKALKILPNSGPAVEISIKMSVVMPIFCVFCNPWIFYFKNPRFRYAFKKAYLSFRKKFKNEVDVA